MTKNVLSEDTPRMGWLFDGNPNTPHIAVMLRNTGQQIVLTVPTKGMHGAHEQYSRWFSAGISYADEPERTQYQYKPPRVLLFQDSDGCVVLVGCRDAGSRATIGAGHGSIVSNFAVLGGKNLRYDKINGLRSELPALVEWSGKRSVHPKTGKDDGAPVQTVEVSLKSPPRVPLNRRMNLTLEPTWRTSFPDKIGTFAAHDIVQLETTSVKASTWDHHLEQHIAIRDLLVLAAWHPFGFSNLEVNRADDPEQFLSGDTVRPRWASVATHRLPKHKEWKKRPRFLFTLDDIGTKGVRRWLKLRTRFARAIDPIVALADQSGNFWEPLMVQSGIAMEALGYQIEIDNGGENLNGRGQLTYPQSLEVILNDMPYIPLEDAEDWKRRSRECYMGVKHADNSVPDSVVLANTLRENLLVARFWVAGRLGCKKPDLRRRLDLDPLSVKYTAAD